MKSLDRRFGLVFFVVLSALMLFDQMGGEVFAQGAGSLRGGGPRWGSAANPATSVSNPNVI